MKPDAVNAAHIARVSAVDALVAEPIPLTGVMLVAERDGSSAVAIAAYTEAAPDTAARTWDATRRHSLDVRFAGPDRAAVLGDVLDQWLDGIDSTAGDTDSAAVVELPSRDTEAVLALVHRGFVPVNVLAIRTAGRPSPPAETDVRIRPATPADLDVAVELNLEVVRYDAPFGKVTPRPETAEVLRNQLTYLFGLSEPSVWLAERNDQVVGLVHVQLPPTSAWVNRYAHARLGDVGYLA
ncbi:MAG: GNAT family N-acetyltransferase, partial [Actinomycetota bacterium]|nr:GNAT family N-acetyltransferase [Actinomycetota bacterium]